jgi:D-psicose/D-tagatose/L-ribulose 3-epimerase
MNHVKGIANMKIGVCGYIRGKNADGAEFDLLAEAKRIGFDYVELPLSTIAGLSEEEYTALRETIQKSGLPCEACNVFFPGTLRLTGLDVDRRKIHAYLEMALERAAGLGVQVVVFGSAGARNVPDSFPINQAWMQLIDMLRTAGPIAAMHGITIAIEPLNQGESNIIQTASEGFVLAKLVDHASVQLLVDYYHMSHDGEDCGIIRTARAWVKHAHFADPAGRIYPAENKAHFQDFFGALKDIGYSGRVSLEAGYQDFGREAPTAHGIMRALAR